MKSRGTAEALSSGEKSDIGMIIKRLYNVFYGMQIARFITVDYKYLYRALSTKRKLIDRSIHEAVIVIRYELENRAISQLI